MKIFFATCEEKPNGTADDHVLRDQLLKGGAEVEFKTWTDAAVTWSDADCVLIRSVWDYHRQLPDFLKWAERVEGLTQLRNPFGLIKWNSSKHYLLELEAKGIPVIPSAFASEENQALAILKRTLDSQRQAVLKPAVSASAELTFHITEFAPAKDLVKKILSRGDVLIQPFISSISNVGELSLIYFQAQGKIQFSHAVHKLPRAGDFRVQSDFGGTVAPVSLSKELIEIGYTSLATLPTPPLYARVDIVNWEVQPQIGEIELIEPQLFFLHSDHAASMLADELKLR